MRKVFVPRTVPAEELEWLFYILLESSTSDKQVTKLYNVLTKARRRWPTEEGESAPNFTRDHIALLIELKYLRVVEQSTRGYAHSVYKLPKAWFNLAACKVYLARLSPYRVEIAAMRATIASNTAMIADSTATIALLTAENAELRARIKEYLSRK